MSNAKIKKGKRTMEFMDKELMKDLFELRKKGMEVFDKYEDQIVGFLRKEKVTAEESLQRDLLFEMYQYGNTLFDLIEYMGKEVVQEGVLDRDEKGNIRFNGKVMSLMSELEVYIADKTDQKVWVRVFTVGEDKIYLAGLNKDLDVNGLKARIRG